MKKLICASDIDKILEEGMNQIEIDKDTLITPAAKDIIMNNGILILMKEEKEEDDIFRDMNTDKLLEFFKIVSNDSVLQKKIIEILLKDKKFDKEIDSSGFSLIKGNSIKFNKVFQNLNIYAQDLINTEDEIIGMLKIEKDTFIKKTKFNGNLYVIKGEIEITLNGKKFLGEESDLINIPKNLNLKIESKEEAHLLYFSKSLGWSEPFL